MSTASSHPVPTPSWGPWPNPGRRWQRVHCGSSPFQGVPGHYRLSERSPPPPHSADMGGGGVRGPGDGHMGLGPLLHPHTWPASHRSGREGPQPHLTLTLRFLVTPANCVVGPAHTPATPETFPQAPLSTATCLGQSFIHSLTHSFIQQVRSEHSGGRTGTTGAPPPPSPRVGSKVQDPLGRVSHDRGLYKGLRRAL